MKVLKNFLLQNKGIVALTSSFIVLQIIGILGVPMLVARLINLGILKNDLDAIKLIAIQMIIVTVLGTIAAVIGSYLSGILGGRFGRQIRKSFFQKFQELSISDIDKIGSSTLLTRMTNDVDNVQQMIVMFCQLILPAPIIAVFALTMTYLNAPNLLWIPLVAILFYLVVLLFLLKKGTPIALSIQPKMDRITTKLREFFTGINMIRAFNNQDHEEMKTNESFTNYANQMIQVNKIFAFITPTAFLIMGVVYASILWVGGYLVGNQTIQIGNIAAITEYALLALSYLMLAAMVFVVIPRSVASLKRLEEVMDFEPSISDPEPFSFQIRDASAASYQNVSFAYGKESNPVIEKISFTIPAGKTTAIVGATGSGKSTLMKLLLRINDPTSGEIKLNDVPTTALTQSSIRKQVAYVPQKAFLFKGTIKSNLLMGKADATPAEIDQAAKISQLKSFVDTLPDKYESFTAQGGSNYSGGQKQRICIARALIKPASMYVFDDSFSALDYQTDAALREALTKELSNKTLVIIAQRLSTIAHADHIILMENGKIAGEGTHQELLCTNKIYQEIAASQGMKE
ncbi:ABC transporter ATP-binding protein [Enterococcus thailandicus]|uniref:Multidrug ABC transporter ATP-binding protein n=1 Tax=Enterococcus thailandicus TaxID=417368 RepID=A0A1L8XRG4_ENTTH|nr:ABC transporter ATP-binding protein [Enterococcus thailandicus]ASZ07485.1 ABC transporter ATP-binding protein [Enterococcus thailandicus]OJG95834.1 ABC transporter ATP-binding/permease [Enterococcus thailandicus]GEK36328.1 multidrug ABC transporter ATP-binding protein [Enterococcus thailandicus]